MSSQILENRFEITSQLSRTDFCATYLACDRHYVHRPLCLVSEIAYRQPEMRHRLEREAQTLERLGHHPQIPRLLTYFYQSAGKPLSPTDEPSVGLFYFVQDHILGHPLSQEIVPPRQLSESYVVKLLQDVLSALSFVHEQGVVHQNLHPQNLIRQDIDGQIFLTQFGGLAKLARSTIAADGALACSVPVSPHPYTASEQLKSDYLQHPQPASDLYALGLIAIEALTGQHPYDLAYDPQTGLRWRDQVNISLPLAEFIDRLVRHRWEDRFCHAKEALATFELHNARHRIAQDSRLPTILAAPGSRGGRKAWPRATGRHLPSLVTASSLPVSKSAQYDLNPALLKFAIASTAIVLAVGITVKIYQWGEYRVSRLPHTWQAWQQDQPVDYSLAALEEVIPLLEDRSILLRPTAAEAFWQMVIAAQAEGVELYPLSGYRSDTDDDYRTGYALDIGGEVESADRHASFAQTIAFQWLRDNAESFGFELSKPKGSWGAMSEEPWHWRYIGDLQSQQMFGIKDQ